MLLRILTVSLCVKTYFLQSLDGKIGLIAGSCWQNPYLATDAVHSAGNYNGLCIASRLKGLAFLPFSSNAEGCKG